MTICNNRILIRIWIVPVFFALSFGALSCGSQQAAQQAAEEDLAEQPDGDAAAHEAVDEAVAAADGDEESECLGQLVPPRGAHGRQYDQETAISQQAGFDELTERARSTLRDRICQDVLCSQIEQNISIWEPQESAGYRCVMAVIESSHIEAWKEEVETELGTRLQESAEDLVGRLQNSLGEESPRVTIAQIEDHGVPGGQRAEWIHPHLQYALEQASAQVVPLQPNWSGHGLPDRVDGVITAQIVPMQGVEASLEMSWGIQGVDQIFTGRALSFPEAVAPDIDRSTYLPSLDLHSDKVALHFDSREGGGLCHGQKTEVWLETAQDMHVRLINLYGRDGGLVIHPPTPDADTLIEAGQPVSIGEFEAMQAGDIGVERFLVVASPTREGLDSFASVDQFCRLPSSMAGDLQRGHNLPHGDDIHLFETGFRLMSGDECTDYDISDQQVAQFHQAIEAAPSCW